MNYIDLLKVGSGQQEAAIAYSKITEPTIYMDGINMNAIFVLLMACSFDESNSDVGDMFGDYNEGVFTLGKSSFDSIFGDVLHEGTYNFFTDTASIDEEILSNSEFGAFGKGGINLTARIVRYPFLEMMLGSLLGGGMNVSIYSIIPDDIYINITLKRLGVEYLLGDSSSSDNSFLNAMSMLPPIGIPVIVMSGDMANEQYGEESVVMYGLGLYTMLGMIM